VQQAWFKHWLPEGVDGTPPVVETPEVAAPVEVEGADEVAVVSVLFAGAQLREGAMKHPELNDTWFSDPKSSIPANKQDISSEQNLMAQELGASENSLQTFSKRQSKAAWKLSWLNGELSLGILLLPVGT